MGDMAGGEGCGGGVGWVGGVGVSWEPSREDFLILKIFRKNLKKYFFVF